MNNKFKIKYEKYKNLQSKKENAYSKYNNYSKQVYKIKEDLHKFILSEKLYIPISELSKYEGENIDEIDLVLDTGEIKHFWRDELMGVQNGYFYYSSYEGGIYEYDKETGKYKSHYRFNSSEGDKVLGYINLEINNIFDTTKNKKEGFLEDILENYFKKH